VTDMDVDVNEQYLLYSSISPMVHLVDLETLCKKHERLTFSTVDDDGYYGGPNLMSIKFSGDSREVLGGSKNGKILIYDMMQNRVNTVVSGAHDDEINTVCWANRETSNLLYTGSDDCFVKVWDRRALGSSRRPAGVFIGHQEGVTNVASKGDGLYLASNAKD
jgi:WD repeat-containing protein 23